MAGNEITKKDQQSPKEVAPAKEEVLDELPKEVSDIIDTLPPEHRKTIISGFQLLGNFNPSPLLPIIKKLTPEHIDKIIQASDDSDKRHYSFALYSKLLNTLYALIAIGVFIFLTIFLSKDQGNLYREIISVLVAFGGGFGIGIGYQKNKQR